MPLTRRHFLAGSSSLGLTLAAGSSAAQSPNYDLIDRRVAPVQPRARWAVPGARVRTVIVQDEVLVEPPAAITRQDLPPIDDTTTWSPRTLLADQPLDIDRLYGPVPNEPFPIPAVDLRRIDPMFLRSEVAYVGSHAPGTIVVDPRARYLYWVQPGARAIRYGVGVGRAGFAWSGIATINSKQQWPDWYPPAEMIARQPEIRSQLTQLQSGIGMAGGPRNPLGARALYLWQNNRDTLYRIHGTTEPWTIGRNVSSGCIRMVNQDAIDLYNRVPVGTQVVVLT